MMKSALLLVLLATSAAAQTRLDYEVQDVRRKLLLEAGDVEKRLATGDALASGDLVRTGWMSRAEIAAPEHAASFLLDARTRVRLTHDVPGALLQVERGRLRAIFDELFGNAPAERIVTTPSAILAVRGTEYGVDVDGNGSTRVVVFSGTVEVLDRERRGTPVAVGEGFWVEVRPGGMPGAARPHGMSRDAFDRGAGPQGMNSRGMSPGQGTGMGAGSSGMGAGGSHHRGGMSGRGGSGGHGE